MHFSIFGFISFDSNRLFTEKFVEKLEDTITINYGRITITITITILITNWRYGWLVGYLIIISN